MSPFKPAVNQQAYVKAGLLGFAGSGKSTTAMELCSGIAELEKKPIFYIDTENGSDFFVSRMKARGIGFEVWKTRAFVDLCTAVNEAVKAQAILQIDSVTHFWAEVMASYMRQKNRTKLTFADWNPIKSTWAKFTDLYLNSPAHIAMCGRAAFEYDHFIDEAGDKKIEKVGTKMSAEANIGFEPSLLIEMVAERIDNADKSPNARNIENVAYVIKDRSDLLNGKRFVKPTFKDFKPHYDFLNIGGEHVGVDTSRSSKDLFEPGNDNNWLEKKKQIAILKEEVEGLLVSAYPGRSAEDSKTKADLAFEAFGTRSWTALDDYTPEAMREGLGKMKALITARQEAKAATAAADSEKKTKTKEAK